MSLLNIKSRKTANRNPQVTNVKGVIHFDSPYLQADKAE